MGVGGFWFFHDKLDLITPIRLCNILTTLPPPPPLHRMPHPTHTQDEITCFRISETCRKHATPCFRYVYVKVVRFHCIRSNGNARKRHETGNGNTGYPSCFRNGLTCFCHVSVYGFLQFRPVTPIGS